MKNLIINNIIPIINLKYYLDYQKMINYYNFNCNKKSAN